MNRKEITKKLSELTELYISPNSDPRIYWAKEVTFDNGTLDQKRVDYMKFVSKNNSVSGIEGGKFYCYEVKSCIEDFNSKNGHNFIGDYNYYVMEESLYMKVKERVPFHVGVLVPSANTFSSLEVVKKAKCITRTRPVSEMLLMMFRSANRENIKNRKAVSKIAKLSTIGSEDCEYISGFESCKEKCLDILK